MSLKAILVHLDDTEHCHVRLDIAVILAQRYDAHLTGYFAVSNPHARRRGNGKSALLRTENLFREKTAAAGVEASWHSTNAPDIVERAILRSYYADLVIIGQAQTNAGAIGVPPDFPERVVLGAGRPVLVIPNWGEFATIGESVMVAWRSGRAASRALNDAIPVLQRAKTVKLLMVNPSENFESEAENLCSYLAHHGISASSDRVSADDLSAGDILLNQACDQGTDLIVLGVLARTRLGVSVGLGPVGSHFLEHMTIPVLMSR
jgi:nucleotide-binding universal stress UspA family protein